MRDFCQRKLANFNETLQSKGGEVTAAASFSSIHFKSRESEIRSGQKQWQLVNSWHVPTGLAATDSDSNRRKILLAKDPPNRRLSKKKQPSSEPVFLAAGVPCGNRSSIAEGRDCGFWEVGGGVEWQLQVAAAATAAAPPFYFCTVATSKREPAGLQSVSQQEAGEGSEPVASRGERAGRLPHQGVKSQENKSKSEKCALSGACVHMCICVSRRHWQNETRPQE